MSTRTPLHWKKELAQVLRDPKELAHYLALDKNHTDELIQSCQDFPLRIPRPYLERIRPGNLQDPLLLQVLPQVQETLQVPGFSTDPLEEAVFMPCQGLLHKYHGRVLVVLNSNCAIHCRYCFRRHFPYQENRISPADWQTILAYITADPTIEEVIFSGGDPLTATDESLTRYTESLTVIPHIKRLRFHTRLPIMIPQRITATLLELLNRLPLQTVLVLHSNHAQELDGSVQAALSALADKGVVLLNQSVLLKGVNDSVAVLSDLSQRLLACRTLPYYLFLLDNVQGAAHFQVDFADAMALQAALQSCLPGYLVPRFAKEEPHKPHKTLYL